MTLALIFLWFPEISPSLESFQEVSRLEFLGFPSFIPQGFSMPPRVFFAAQGSCWRFLNHLCQVGNLMSSFQFLRFLPTLATLLPSSPPMARVTSMPSLAQQRHQFSTKMESLQPLALVESHSGQFFGRRAPFLIFWAQRVG